MSFHFQIKSFFVIGGAGCGKTNLVLALKQRYEQESFVINLDPAVLDTLYKPDLDIRDFVDYQQLINEQLGPNGAILTALNLFVAKLSVVTRQIPSDKMLIFDAPGQIESFVWSASGEILLDTFIDGILIYVLDGEKCIKPVNYVSNMTYLLSIQARMNIKKILVVVNKIDLLQNQIQYNENQSEHKYNTYQELIKAYNDDMDALQDQFYYNLDNSDYIDSFMQNACTYLQEFWDKNEYVYVSAHSGQGMSQLIEKMDQMSTQLIKENDIKLEKRKHEMGEKVKQQLEQIKKDCPNVEDLNQND